MSESDLLQDLRHSLAACLSNNESPDCPEDADWDEYDEEKYAEPLDVPICVRHLFIEETRLTLALESLDEQRAAYKKDSVEFKTLEILQPILVNQLEALYDLQTCLLTEEILSKGRKTIYPEFIFLEDWRFSYKRTDQEGNLTTKSELVTNEVKPPSVERILH